MSKTNLAWWVAMGWLSILGGCASNPANPADAYEGTNRAFYDFNDTVDANVLKPVADAYTDAVPSPIRRSLHNAFDNLTYLETIFNGLLQGKFEQSGGDSLRMLVNSTAGLAGLFDPATELGLKHHDEDFGLTLGAWGVDQGTYLVLPLLGPTTGRDVWAWPVAIATDPLTYLSTPLEVWLPLDATRVVDFRASADNAVRFRAAAALDPYVFTREAYLQNREYRVTGSPAATQPALNYFEDDTDAGPLTRPATRPVNPPTTQPGPSAPRDGPLPPAGL
jgi:phospholipid-binding lipoprotein MlaA